jgi:hypothetical protein
MRSWSALAVLAAAATGCNVSRGNAEDFTVKVMRPTDVVMRPLSSLDIRDADVVFPGIAVHRSRPSNDEVLYTIPGETHGTVLLHFESTDAGKATVIHATVNLPATQRNPTGRKVVVSERKIVDVLERTLRNMGRNLEKGSSARSDGDRFAGVLVGIAVASNEKYLDEALYLRDHPDPRAEAEIRYEQALAHRRIPSRKEDGEYPNSPGDDNLLTDDWGR